MVEVEIKQSYKKSELGLIPSDWKIQNLETNSTLKARIGWQGLTTDEYKEIGEYFLVTGTDFNDGKILWDTCHYVDEFRYIQDKNIQLKNDDILVTKDGTIGKVAIVENLNKPATLNSGVFVIRPKGEDYVPKYFFYVLTSKFFKEFLNQLVAGSTISHLYQKDFVNFNFIVPPIAEQKLIAKTLSDVDLLILALEKLVQKKKKVKRGVMQQLLSGKKRFKGFKGKWETKQLGDIAEIVRGASPRPIENPIWFDENSTIGWVRISDVTKSVKYLTETTQKLSELGIKNSRYVGENNLIMSICATVGRPILTRINVCIHDGFVVFRKPEVEINYLYYYLTFIEENWSKNGQTGSQMNLNTTIINSEIIGYPEDKNEQIKIASILSDIDSELFALEKKLEKYKLVKQGMMQNLLTGKIRLV